MRRVSLCCAQKPHPLDGPLRSHTLGFRLLGWTTAVTLGLVLMVILILFDLVSALIKRRTDGGDFPNKYAPIDDLATTAFKWVNISSHFNT